MPRIAKQRENLLAILGEVFREHGYEGASLSLIGQATGLGKGSLYHFFPGGKEEMASAVLEQIDHWFEQEIFAPLRQGSDPVAAIEAMLGACTAYFESGRRICLVGAFALGDVRERFSTAINSYFQRWTEALALPLTALGHDAIHAHALAEEIVAGIQGAIVLARAMDAPDVFERALGAMRRRALNPPSGYDPPAASWSA